MTINQLVLAYLKYAEGYYRKNGKPTREYGILKEAASVLVEGFGDTPVLEFGPLRLKCVRDQMIERGWSRRYINKQVGRIVRGFRWGVENELVPETVYRALRAVSGLKKGRSQAPDYEPVGPAEPSIVESTLTKLSGVIADMVRFQQLTGCRPEEVCALNRDEIDTSADVWIFRPGTHKTMHLGRDRFVCIGPKAQEIIAPYMLKIHNSFLFNPRDAIVEVRAERLLQRKTPLNHGNRSGTNRVHVPKKPPGDRYTTASYRRAITRACDAAFPVGKNASPDEIRARNEKYRWTPNQLRHFAATAIRAAFGLEESQVVLGHASADVTQIYAHRDLRLAMEIMRKMG
jgi:integrase